jgi:hypothetical protein
MAVTRPKLMTVADPGLSRRARWLLIGFLSVYLVLYVATGIGGYRSQAQQLRAEAEAGCQQYKQMQWLREGEEAEREVMRQRGLEPPRRSPHLDNLRPKYRIAWCVPVLPGILLVDSSYSLEQRLISSGTKLVFYYGFGSYDLWVDGEIIE